VAYNGVIHANTPLALAPAPTMTSPASIPVLQSTDQYNVVLNPGDTVTATLSYADTSAGQLGGNDLDLTLLLPSQAPIPIVLPPTQDFIVKIVTSRVARTTCTDSAIESNNHPAAGGAFGESISFTVPANGEAGTYALLVRGFLVTVDQPYSLSLSVGDANGRDLTAARAPALAAPTTLVTTNPHCELI
jgi:hypothetical protein